MPNETQTRDVVRSYHEAWTGERVADAGDFIADGFSTRAPVGSYDSRADYLQGLANFRTRFVTGVDLISELYGTGEATLLYDVHTNTPAGTIRTAEHFTLTGGKISSTILVFDATEWRAMMAAQGQTVDAEGHVIALDKNSSATAAEDTLDVVRAYHRGWTSKTFDQAISLLSPTLTVEVPVNDYPTTESFAKALVEFASLVTDVRLLAEMSHGDQAMLLYDMDVKGLGTMRVAEHFTVADGRITMLRQIHDTAAVRAAGFASS
jgi:hypothetical protein